MGLSGTISFHDSVETLREQGFLLAYQSHLEMQGRLLLLARGSANRLIC